MYVKAAECHLTKILSAEEQMLTEAEMKNTAVTVIRMGNLLNREMTAEEF